MTKGNWSSSVESTVPVTARLNRLGKISALLAGENNVIAANKSRSNIEMIGKGENGQTASTSLQSRTWQRIVALRGVPLIMRAQFQNPTAVPYVVDKTNVKLSTTFVSGGDPTGSMTPLNLLWSTAAAAIVGAGTLDAPAYTPWSDPLLLPTVTRSDGNYPLAYIRSWIDNGLVVPAAATAYPYHSAQYGYAKNPNNVANGLIRSYGFRSGDYIATPTGFSGNDEGVGLLMNLEFTEFSRGIKVVSLGDSILSGSAASGGSLGGADNTMVDQALALINPSTVSYGTILSHSNCGVASTYLTQFLPRLPNILTQQTPDIVIIPVWSPNNSPTTKALLDANNALVLRAISQILAAGAVPILLTSPPQNSTTAAIDALRISNNNLWRRIAAEGGFILADLASVMDGSVVSGVTQYALTFTNDGTHPSDEGQKEAALLIADSLLIACGIL